MLLTLDTSSIKHYRPRRLNRPDLRRSAVLIPVIQDEATDRIVFTARHEQLRFQPSDISFPGGKADPNDPDLSRCALRETQEEIGLPPQFVNIIGEMDQVTVSSRFLVTPFVGLVAADTPINPGVGEVRRLIVLNVSDLLTQASYETVPHIQNGVSRLTYKFTISNVTIWGATARILKLFLEIGYGAK